MTAAPCLPVVAPWATDARNLATLGIPTYGFSPLRLRRDERVLDRLHGVDERVSLSPLWWGLAVLYDAVYRYCAAR